MPEGLGSPRQSPSSELKLSLSVSAAPRATPTATTRTLGGGSTTVVSVAYPLYGSMLAGAAMRTLPLESISSNAVWFSPNARRNTYGPSHLVRNLPTSLYRSSTLDPGRKSNRTSTPRRLRLWARVISASRSYNRRRTCDTT